VRANDGLLGHGQKEMQLLQAASAFTRELGGARVTHCKSGKDRTVRGGLSARFLGPVIRRSALTVAGRTPLYGMQAMSVTLEHAEVISAARQQELPDPEGQRSHLRQLMRSHGGV